MAAQRFFQDNADATKLVDLDVAAVSTGTTRTITMPDKSGVLFEASSIDIDGAAITNLAATDVKAALAEHQADLDLLESGLVYQGEWDASGGSFPGAGAAQTGWFYKVSVGGTVDGVTFSAGDSLYAATDNASTTTYTANWNQIASADAVLSVHGRLGAVVAAAGDYTASQITNVAAGNIAATTVQAAIDELDAEKVAANLTEGTLAVATANRSADFGNFDLALTNIGDLTFEAATFGGSSGGQPAWAFDAARQMTLGAYTGATFDAAATKSLGVDATGKVVTFTAAAGATNLTLGTVSTTTAIVESDTGTDVTLPAVVADSAAGAADGTAGLMTAAQAQELDSVKVLANGSIFVGNASNVPTAVTLSGDLTIDNAGVATVLAADTTQAGKVELAVAAEAAAATSNTVALTPLSVAGLIMSTATKQTYTESNVTTTRAIDADAITHQALADVVATLLGDLRAKGIVA